MVESNIDWMACGGRSVIDVAIGKVIGQVICRMISGECQLEMMPSGQRSVLLNADGHLTEVPLQNAFSGELCVITHS